MHVCCCLALSKLIVFLFVCLFFFKKMYKWCLLSFSNFVIVLINWQDFVLSNSVCNHTCDWQIRLPFPSCLILLITYMITDWVGLHSAVLLPLSIIREFQADTSWTSQCTVDCPFQLIIFLLKGPGSAKEETLP